MVSIEQNRILNLTLKSSVNLKSGLLAVKNLLKLMVTLIAFLVGSVGLSMYSPLIRELLPMKYDLASMLKSNP